MASDWDAEVARGLREYHAKHGLASDALVTLRDVIRDAEQYRRLHNALPRLIECLDKSFVAAPAALTIGESHDEAERLRDVLHRMLEAPTTQVSLNWKEAVRLALAGRP